MSIVPLNLQLIFSTGKISRVQPNNNNKMATLDQKPNNQILVLRNFRD
jgi:hypothetical protein